MRWTALLVPVVVASCATPDEGAGVVGRAAGPVAGTEQRSDVPGDARIETVDDLGVSFALPRDWVTVPSDLVAAATDEAQVDAIAGDLGVDPSTLTDLLDDGLALAAVGPDATTRANLNVLELPIPGGVPSEAMLEAALDVGGAEVLEVGTVTRDPLAIVDIRYRLTVADLPMEVAALYFESGRATVGITVSSTDRRETDRVGDLVVATLDAPG